MNVLKHMSREETPSMALICDRDNSNHIYSLNI